MRITWADSAIRDLDAIHDFIARDSPHYATRCVERLIEAVDPLADLPRVGRIVPEGDGRHREIIEPPYRILYRVEGDQIYIVRVIHGARDLTALRESGELDTGD